MSEKSNICPIQSIQSIQITNKTLFFCLSNGMFPSIHFYLFNEQWAQKLDYYISFILHFKKIK